MSAASLVAHAGEIEDRNAIAAQFAALFEKEDFAAIDALYARARDGDRRTESGLFAANQLVRMMYSRRPERIEHGGDAFWTPVETRAQRWMARSPESTLAAIALARAYLSHGWAYRGGGFANTVGADDARKFSEYTRKARETLLLRESKGRADPNWWATLLDIEQSGNATDTEYRRVAQAALDAFPRNYDIYFQVANKLQPKWGGSMKAIAALADQGVGKSRATDGEAMYARIYWTLYAESNESDFLLRKDVSWPKIRAGFDDMIKQYPAAWNTNFFARMACDARDQATTKRLFKLIGDKVEPRAWTGRDQYNGCYQWAMG